MTKVDHAFTWFAIVAIFCAPLSKPGTNIALALLALTLPFISDLRARVNMQIRSPLVIGGVCLFSIYAVSALHSTIGAAPGLWGYRILFLVGVVALAFPTDALRQRAWLAFIAGSAILLSLSIASGFNLLPRVSTTAVGQFGFAKNYGQQGVIYIVAAAACVTLASVAKVTRYRFALWSLATLFTLATPLLLEGRMSWILMGIVAIALSILFLGTRRGLLVAFIATFALGSVAWLSPLHGSRWGATKNDVAAAVSGEVTNSWGVRAELIRIAPSVIATAPFFGHGLGSWNSEMRKVAPERMNPQIEHLTNPHQELLFIVAEQGLVGAIVYLAIAFLLIRCVFRMEGTAKPLYVALVIAYLGYGLFNAVLADFTHRHVFLLLLALIPLNLKRYENDQS
jgi:O-antigen ligase